MMKKTVKEFVVDVVSSRARELDEFDEFPFYLVQDAGQLGLLSINFSEK